MLTAELVRATKRTGRLHVKPLRGKERERAVEIAEAYLDVTRNAVGQSREEISSAWSEVGTTAREKKLADGLQKLIDDACAFDRVGDADPREVRGDVFSVAAVERRANGRVDRDEILRRVAAARGLDPDALDRALYSDLRAAQCLAAPPALGAEELVARYDHSQIQAVLLRATRVVADVKCASPEAYRALFFKLKFRRLLVRIDPLEDDGYRLTIDGPFSLFESVTKYGLQLALVLPALERAEHLSLVAELRWGKAREPLEFHYEHRRSTQEVEAEARMPDDVAALATAFDALDTPWKARACREVVSIPGVGLCVPDLTFVNADGTQVLFEAMGYWSRDAVWRRVEMAQSGKLPQKMLFAVSQRLRVSEQVLVEDAAALYVYKGVMSPRAVERKLAELASGG